MASEVSIDTFHHEMTHLILREFKFAYPMFFPFWDEMEEALDEGDAIYHERLLNSKIYIGCVNWNEDTIENCRYDIYYQLYTMLMLSIPRDFREGWKFGIFDVTLFTQEQKECYAELFAIMTILSGKTKNENKPIDFLNAINNYSINSSKMLKEVNKIYDTEKQKTDTLIRTYQEQLEELETILNTPLLLKTSYEENLQESKTRLLESNSNEEREVQIKELENLKTIEGFVETLTNSIYSLESDIKEEKVKKENMKSCQDIEFQKYAFGLLLVNIMQKYIDQNLSIQELYQIFVNRVVTIVQERRESSAFVDLLVEELFEENKQTR